MAGEDLGGGAAHTAVVCVDADRKRAATVAAELESEADGLTTSVATPGRFLEESGHEADCIVSGHAPPELDGIALARRLAGGESRVPVVLFVADGSEEAAARAVNGPVEGYVRRDGTDDQYERLATRVRTVVGAARADEPPDGGIESLAEYTSDIICVLDEAGVVSYVSPSVEEALGYAPPELVGEDVFAYVHPEDRETVQEEFRALVSEERTTTRTVQHRLEAADGSWVWLESVGTNRADAAAGGYVVSSRDITDRKRREQELERIERRYEAILDDPDAFIARLDTDGTTLEVNETALAAAGVSHEQVTGEPFWETRLWAQTGDSTDRIRDGIERAAAGESVRLEVEHRDSAGERLVVDVSLRPVRTDGGVESIIAVGRDITEQKDRERALSALYESAREFTEAEDRETVAERAVETARSALEQAVNCIWLYDEEADALEPVAITGEAVDLLGEPPVYEGGDSLSWEVFQTGGHVLSNDLDAEENTYEDDPRLSSEMILSLGEYGVMNIGAMEADAFDEADFTLARLLAAHTEAALRRAEREDSLRQQRARLRSQNERLEEFASIISHDLRNPLNVALMRLDLARQEQDSEDLATVEDALSRMESIIEDTLTLARQGQSVSEMRPVAIDEVATRCWGVVATGEATLDVERPFYVYADPDRFEHVLENLFRNAVEHGAEPTVRVGPLTDGTGFYVEDDGPGIPDDERDEVFDAGHTSADDGTGFGLTIVKTIADAHGWETTVTEGSDGGARFEFGNADVDAS